MNTSFSKRAAILTALKMSDITVNADDDEDIKKVEEDPEGGTIDIEIKTDRPESETTFQPAIPEVEMQMECQRLLCALEGVRLMLSKETMDRVGTENMESLFSTALKTVVNIGSRFAGLFKTYLFHGFEKFKRGEVTYFKDMHRYEYGKILSMNYNELKDRIFPHPRGMEKSFSESYKALRDFLNVVDMPVRVKSIVAGIEAVQRSMLSDNPSFNSVTTVANTLADKNITKAYQKTEQCFTTSSKDTDTFSNLFSDMNDFKTQMENLIEADTELRLVNTIYEDLKTVDSLLKAIDSMKDKITKDNINALATSVSIFGMSFSNYATAVNDLQRLGHAANNILERISYHDEI